MQVTVDETQVDVAPEESFGQVLSKTLSGKKRKQTVACRCNGRVYDLDHTVPATCLNLEPVTEDSPEGLSVLRHSAAHLMAEAVKRLFPSAKVTIGPDIEVSLKALMKRVLGTWGPRHRSTNSPWE